MVELDRFQQVVDAIRSEYPTLRIDTCRDDPQVDANVAIPKQRGLHFEICITLQESDELHLYVGEFWGAWFPAGSDEVSRMFTDAILGLISGRCRIVDHLRRGKVIESQLQECDEGTWRTIYTSHRRHGAIIPWWRSERIILNEPRSG